MYFYFFFTILILILLFLALKLWEDKKNKRVLSEDFVCKCDGKLEDCFVQCQDGCKHLFEKRKNVPEHTLTILGWLLKELNKLRVFTISKIVKILKVHNVQEINGNDKTSSNFLKSIAEEKDALNGDKNNQ